MADKLRHFQDALSLRHFKRSGVDPVVCGLLKVAGLHECLQQSLQGN